MALAQAMLRRGGNDHDFRIILNNHFPDTVAPLRRTLDGLLPQSHITTFDLPGPIWEHDRNNAWRLRAAEQLREYHLGTLKPDVVHLTSLFEGLTENACASILHSRGQFDTAVTLYDLIPLLRKETYLRDENAARWYYRKLQSLKNAEILLGISGHSRQEAIDALQLPADRVVNISSAVDDIFKPLELAPERVQALRQRYGLVRQFIMYTGGIDYRKNIEGLIEAYALLPAELRARYQLAVVCSIQEHDRVRLQEIAARFRLEPNDLVLTGYVSDDDLVALYNLTELFVFPSLQEGFGLPALEAMSCGVPVIGSNNSSIPEVIGRADALFDPNKVTEIMHKMRDVLTNPDFAQDLRQHGLVQCKEFSWDASARKTLEAFEHAHDIRQQQHKVSLSVPDMAPARRPRLAYISPLPPERSGVADQSAELLPELARYYEIDVVVNQPTVSEPWITSNFPIRTVEWFEQNVQRFDRIMYHFGNSAFHQHMFGLLQRHPGVVVLHDFFMSGVMNYMSGAMGHPNAYCKTMYESHGYRALIDEKTEGRDASIYKYPSNRSVLDLATDIIVHSSHSTRMAAQWYGQDVADRFTHIPLLRALPGTIDRAAMRAKLGVAEGDFLACSFGIMAPTKCCEKILEAWLASPLNQDAKAHLVFVGENNVGAYGTEISRRMASNPRIRITGFVTFDEFHDYLSACDVAIQLRTMSRGETSGTILDCMAYHAPTIINAHGSGIEFPEDVTIKLPDLFTIEELSAAMVRMRNEPELRRELVEKADAHMLRLHHPAHVGAVYYETVENLAQYSPAARYKELLHDLGGIDTEVQPTEADWVQAASCIAANRPAIGKPQLLLDVSAMIADGGSESQRALLLQLVSEAPQGWRVEPVVLDEGRYRYARRFTLNLIGRADLVLEDAAAEVRSIDVVLPLDDGIMDALKAANVR
jgi:glycosyltransferase involved in cell wall biosynthesis